MINRAELERMGIRVGIGIVLERSMTDNEFISLASVVQHGYPLLQRAYGRGDMARSDMCKDFLKTNLTHLLLLRQGFVYPSDITERLASWMVDDPNKKIIGTLCFSAEPPNAPEIRINLFGKMVYPSQWGDGIARVDAILDGAILVQREVIERLHYPYWQYSGTENDFVYFCKTAKELGYDIFCDTSSPIERLDSGLVDESAYRAYLKDYESHKA